MFLHCIIANLHNSNIRRRTKTGSSEAHLQSTTSQADVSHLNLVADVLSERDRAYSVGPGEDYPIVLRDLKKEFPAQDGNPKKVVVKNMSLAIARGECFGYVSRSQVRVSLSWPSFDCKRENIWGHSSLCCKRTSLKTTETNVLPPSGRDHHKKQPSLFQSITYAPVYAILLPICRYQVCRLLGSNGAGKSTSINMVRSLELCDIIYQGCSVLEPQACSHYDADIACGWNCTTCMHVPFTLAVVPPVFREGVVFVSG